MTRNWTEEQIRAIEQENASILLSASAGAGKTAVLTGRIIRKLTDKENPCDISRMLIVTFTRAAASELKQRIADALDTALAEAPFNKHIQRQRVLLPAAKICTIHSFCLDLVRTNFYRLGLPADLRVEDPNENAVRKLRIMKEEVESSYSGAIHTQEEIEAFCYFTECVVSARGSERFSEILVDMYDRLSAHPEGIAKLNRCAEEYYRYAEQSVMETPFGEVLKKNLLDFCRHYTVLFKDIEEKLLQMPQVAAALHKTISYEIDFLKCFEMLLDKGEYEKIEQHLAQRNAPKSGKLTDFSGDPFVNFCRSVRKNFAEEIRKFKNTYFVFSSSEISQQFRQTAKNLQTAAALLTRFDKSFCEEKLKFGRIDFADIERYALRLLQEETGEKSELAQSITDGFDEVYIDEFQDINEMQNLLFKQITKNNNCFMVGDIKQSIYGFRGAAPDIFLGYRQSFSEFVDENSAGMDAYTMYLTRNFRCDSGVIDFVNCVCGLVFPYNESMGYVEKDALVFAKRTEKPSVLPKVVLFEKNNQDPSSLKKEDGDAANDEAGTEETDGQDAKDGEALYTAREIQRLMMEDETLRYRDFAVILRSTKDPAKSYIKAFEKLGIPYSNDTGKDLFESSAILYFLSILNCIDNPMREVYLAGAMMGPVFGFSLDELVKIRKSNDTGNLYEVLVEYTHKNNWEKGAAFLEKLKKYRKRAQNESVDRFIHYLMRDISFMQVVFCDGDEEPSVARQHLLQFYECARQFEKGAFGGLYHFLQFIEDLRDEKKSISTVMAGQADAVNILTIHQSKGLEYRVCFLGDASHLYNKVDTKNPLLYDTNLGIATKLRDTSGYCCYNTFLRSVMACEIEHRTVSEEMRLLYVAMTRAKERLYVTATCKNMENILLESENNYRYVSSYIIGKCRSNIQWILMAVVETETTKKICNLEKGEYLPDADYTAKPEKQQAEPYDAHEREELIKRYRERFSYQYPYQILTEIPAKMSVSRLYPRFLDEAEGEERQPLRIQQPKFLYAKGKRAPDPADIGTATHLFMQFCDFSAVEERGMEFELERLVRRGFLDQEHARLVERKSVETFMKSSLYHRMKTALHIWRETRFNIRLPAVLFSASEEKAESLAEETLLVQGIIDCFFEGSDGNLYLVDYKTDHFSKTLSKEAVIDLLTERHQDQLFYYKKAIEKLTQKQVKTVYLYSFHLAEAIEMVFPKETDL